MHPQTQMIDKQNEINDFRFLSEHDGTIDAEVRELELEVTSLRKRRFMLEKALVRARKEIARLQKGVKI